MTKRKLEQEAIVSPNKRIANSDTSTVPLSAIQIITGSYERVLHGVTAWLPSEERKETTFADAFLYQPHTSRITSLALTEASDSKKRTLATGSADERVNLYQISTIAGQRPKKDVGPQVKLSKLGAPISSGNKELGSLLHHGAQVTQLWFAGKSKLLSAAQDNTITITRLRDMAVLSTIKAPVPKALGRPSGDTALAQDLPKGVNGFAVHPSKKLMVSVGRGERCMRLWNLVTGKKAGVLNFERRLLAEIGEGKYSRGEGLSVEWDTAGEEFVVAFERGALVFGIDAKPKAKITTGERTKFHRIRYLQDQGNEENKKDGRDGNILAISTEDGRILFFSTSNHDVSKEGAEDQDGGSKSDGEVEGLPDCRLIAQIGGQATGSSTRIKDFEILQIPSSGDESASFCLAGASSDGTIRVWSFTLAHLTTAADSQIGAHGAIKSNGVEDSGSNGVSDKSTVAAKQIGKLLGQYVTENRITCLAAFVLDLPNDAPGADEVEKDNVEAASSDDDDESD